jgi:hypothetical protein
MEEEHPLELERILQAASGVPATAPASGSGKSAKLDDKPTKGDSPA